jgi:hypothetical protein
VRCLSPESRKMGKNDDPKAPYKLYDGDERIGTYLTRPEARRAQQKLESEAGSAWRWEIYRAGNVNPIKRSSIYFDTTVAAKRAGKDALKELLNKLFA